MVDHDRLWQLLEQVFLYSSSAYVAVHVWLYAPALCIAYLAFVLLYMLGMVRLQMPQANLLGSPLAVLNVFAYLTILLASMSRGASTSPGAIDTGTPRVELSVPGSADDGEPRIPNIIDPLAKDAQTVCPGYKASNVETSNTGFTATLTIAGSNCQVYGNDVETLAFSVSYQAKDRLNVKIQPSYLTAENETWFILPEYINPSPRTEPSSGNATLNNGLSFYWTNYPSFGFRVVRDSTGDTLFNTEGNKIVYEDQFIEFVTAMPADYNLYGLGETIHGFRLGNNFTKVRAYAPSVGQH